jgi:NTP pyrophosphatase (non-canonical NTP hydrolase)
MAKSLKEIEQIVHKFRSDRGWYNDDPNDLVASILIELGELAEHYQWQKSFTKFDRVKKIEVGFEFVDVLFYLLTLSYNSKIDLEKVFDLKIKRLAKKFPVGKSHEEYYQAHKHYRKTGKNKLYK